MLVRERRAVLVASLLTGITIAATVTSCGSSPTGTKSLVLHIGAIPDQNPEKLNRLYSSLSDELSDQLTVPVQYVPVSNYPAAVSAFRTGSLDLVWFGGLTGVQARLQTPGAKVLAQRDIDAKFTSVFIANGASGLRPISNGDQLTNLKGRRLSFGSESSTSGRLMPQYFMSQNGVETADLAGGAPGFSGSHDATIEATLRMVVLTPIRCQSFGERPHTSTTTGWRVPISMSVSAMDSPKRSNPHC